MSASCDMTIKFVGTDEEFNALLAKLKEIEGPKDYKSTYNAHYPFRVREHSIYAENGACRNIWGSDYLYPEHDMFVELAKVVPNAEFTVESARVYEGGGGGCETYLQAEYKNNQLVFKLLPYVDTMSIPELASGANRPDIDEVNLAIVGRLKFHQNREELSEYFECYDANILEKVSPRAHYVICNYPNMKSKELEKAKELNIPVISEAAAIRMFGDVYDFDDNRDKLVADWTYEDFCKAYVVDDTITKEVFENAKTNYESFVLFNDNEVSAEGRWHESLYIISTPELFE